MQDSSKNPYSILFVEDEEATRKNYVTYLCRYFQNVYEAEDGIEAYALYLKYQPQILIVDINMPNMNGIELLQKIRLKDHRVKSIILTAHTDTKFLLQASELKLTKYLLKPVTRAELKEALDLVINELNSFDIISKKTYILKENHLWDCTQQKLFKNNIEVTLTLQESKIIGLLFDNINNKLSYETIILYLWDDFEKDKINAVKIAIKKLRKKLPDDTIANNYGFGY
jgi:DNA-binding response OmpR family regulator